MDCADCFFDHREKHEEFAQKVRDLREKHDDGEYITMEVVTFVRDWLDSHIAGINQDQNYADYYEENLAGDYEYEPGKLREDRAVESAHPEAEDDETEVPDFEVSLTSKIHSGDALSIPDGPMAAWFDRIRSRHEGKTATRHPERAEMDDRTFEQLFEHARSVAGGLLERGLEPGDRVGIYADPRYEWSVVDLACQLAGLVSVPVSNLYDNERALHIIDDADVDVLVAESTLPITVEQAVETALRLDTLPDTEPDDLPGFDRDPDDPATIVYKLGTDEHPRGCTLTHRNLLASIAMLEDRLPLGSDGTGTCFLPLGHIYQRSVTYYLWHTGNAVAYMHSENVIEHLQSVQPDLLVGVPRAYDRLHEQMQSRLGEMGGAKRLIANEVAETYGERMREGKSATAGLSLKHKMATRTVFPQLREEFGLDELTYALTGTESIDDGVLHFFWGLGVPMREIYESTELTGLATITGPEDFRADTVGEPFPGMEIALAEDGEVVVRGPNVMDGYWDDEQATAYAIRDDWYHTGDLGDFDGNHLQILDSK
jgi:long-subunit acyl-CoA synthetase (AMP-forming)